MNYLTFANIPKTTATKQDVEAFIALAEKNPRVDSISNNDSQPGYLSVKMDELNGCFSMQKIAAALHESDIDRKARLAVERAPLPDTINIDLDSCDKLVFADPFDGSAFQFPRSTIKKMHEYAQSLPPSAARAQCYTIACYEFAKDETIADRFIRDHANVSNARRQAQLMVEAGCANETGKVKNYYGKIVFQDGSSI